MLSPQRSCARVPSTGSTGTGRDPRAEDSDPDDPAIRDPARRELAAVGLGALQGALFAGQSKAQRIDLLGVVLIGIGVALGGSLSRDILLGVTPTLIQSNWYLLTGAVAALVGMLLLRLFDRLSAVILVLDAVTIGTFRAIGTTKALTLGAPEIPAVFVGAIAAVGGSVVGT